MDFWLKEKDNVEDALRNMRDQGLLEHIVIGRDPATGQQYVRVPITVGDPPTELTDALELLAERVTVSVNINRTLCPDGVYRHGDAHLVVMTTSNNARMVGIRGPTVTAVNTIYTLFCRGMLTPTETVRGEQQHAPSGMTVH